MKRPLLIIGICLLLGAVVNVAVAWGCAAWSPLTSSVQWSQGRAAQLLERRQLVPSPDDRFSAFGGKGFGRTLIQAVLDPYANLDENARIESRGKRLGGVVVDYDAGWPLRTLRVEFAGIGRDFGEIVRSMRFVGGVRAIESEPFKYLLPLTPLWPGFAFNTLFYATILWLLIPGPFALRRFLRLRRGLCPQCAYPMGESSVCTECGCRLPKRASTA